MPQKKNRVNLDARTGIQTIDEVLVEMAELSPQDFIFAGDEIPRIPGIVRLGDADETLKRLYTVMAHRYRRLVDGYAAQKAKGLSESVCDPLKFEFATAHTIFMGEVRKRFHKTEHQTETIRVFADGGVALLPMKMACALLFGGESALVS